MRSSPVLYLIGRLSEYAVIKGYLQLISTAYHRVTIAIVVSEEEEVGLARRIDIFRHGDK